jgi:hypothetical protein
LISNHKIKSFTLAELLVVLVLSALVVSISLSVLNLIQKQIGSIRRIEDRGQEILFLERALWQDFNRGTVFYDPDLGQLNIYGTLDTISYELLPEYVLRNNDTLLLEVSNLVCYLDGYLVENNQVDAIELSFSTNYLNAQLFVYQNKDGAHYLNY